MPSFRLRVVVIYVHASVALLSQRFRHSSENRPLAFIIAQSLLAILLSQRAVDKYCLHVRLQVGGAHVSDLPVEQFVLQK